MTSRDLALDLFGYPPRRRILCPGCGEKAEPYRGSFCWRCATAVIDGRRLTQMQLVLSTSRGYDAERMCVGEGGNG